MFYFGPETTETPQNGALGLHPKIPPEGADCWTPGEFADLLAAEAAKQGGEEVGSVGEALRWLCSCCEACKAELGPEEAVPVWGESAAYGRLVAHVRVLTDAVEALSDVIGRPA